MAEKFSLKDYLFNKNSVEKIANEIYGVYPSFRKKQFVTDTLSKFPELALKQRISWISDMLKKYLPENYTEAVTILLRALPSPLDHTKTDNDFGEFIYAPYAEFIAKNGRTKNNLVFSLQALKEITMRFSAEDAIRYFLNDFPDETLATLKEWSKDSHYHVRRLASEGTRPKLPWAQKLLIAPEKALPILENLYYDNTRYVTRSVANHMNDISKINSDLTLQILKKWKDSQKQNEKEMEYIIHHALRSLIKGGNPQAISFLQFSTDPQILLSDFYITNDPVKMGDSLEFHFTIKAKDDEKLIIDYVLYFINKDGKLTNKKVFKIKKLSLKKNQSITITKKHKMLEQMTTRSLYPGKHKIIIQVNGKQMIEKYFDLIK